MNYEKIFKAPLGKSFEVFKMYVFKKLPRILSDVEDI